MAMGADRRRVICTVAILHYRPAALSTATYEMGFRAAVQLLGGPDEGADEAATLVNLVGSSTGFTGVHGFMAAESVVGVIPKILIAPGFTHQQTGGNANPVVAEMLGLAKDYMDQQHQMNIQLMNDLYEQGKRSMEDVEKAYEMYSISDLMEKAKEMYSFVSKKD